MKAADIAAFIHYWDRWCAVILSHHAFYKATKLFQGAINFGGPLHTVAEPQAILITLL